MNKNTPSLPNYANLKRLPTLGVAKVRFKKMLSYSNFRDSGLEMYLSSRPQTQMRPYTIHTI